MSEYEIRRLPGEATLADAHRVRRIVFMDEQGVSEAEEMDGRDRDAVHVVAYAPDGDPVGTSRYRTPDPGVAKIERVAVCAPHRGEGLGRRLMEEIESCAREDDCTTAMLHAQVSVEEFYEDLGYRTVSEEFLEADIPHVKMTKSL
jgi:predicted GNAT family N-acyltransferase